MPMIVTDLGERNILEVDPALLESLAGTITFIGDGNVLTVAPPFAAHALVVHLGGGARVRLGANCHAGHLELHAGRGGTIVIGEDCAFNGLVRVLAHEPACITLGRGCLVAPDVVIAASDMHSVLHRRTRERLNRAADVVIGDRVWIGFRAFVTKGASIGEGSVIGAQSVVTRAIPPHTMAAGLPARPLRHDIDWTFELIGAPGVQEA